MSVVIRCIRAVATLLSQAFGALVDAVVRILAFIERWLITTKHAQYGTAVMRMLLGFAALGTLLSNFAARSYLYGPAAAWARQIDMPFTDIAKTWIFSTAWAVSGNIVSLTILYVVLIVLAVLVIIGWRARIVLPIFFCLYIGLIELNTFSGDQGDNAWRILTIYLMFTDHSARLSLDARRRARAPQGSNAFLQVLQGAKFMPEWLTNAVHNLMLALIAVQVCYIYASGALFKAGGAKWSDGTAVYGPLLVERFAIWPEVSHLITTWGPMVTAAVWGSIVLQMSFPFMLLNRFTRIIALGGILTFHVSIAVLMGLPWFSLAMIAADAIFIRDVSYRTFGSAVKTAWRNARGDSAEGQKTPRSRIEAAAEAEAAEQLAGDRGAAPALTRREHAQSRGA